jgi:integrase/recombinase XerC/integrase/recombinase XerD
MSHQLTTTQQALTSTTYDAERLIALFTADCDVNATSRKGYGRALRQYFNWIDQNGLQLTDVARTEILRYKDELQEAGRSSLTISAYLNSVRRFYDWAEANKYYPNVAKGIRSPKRKQAYRKQPLRPQQAQELLQYCATTLPARDYAIVNLLIRTGLRTIEAVRANVGDLTYKGGQRVLLVHGKGRSEKDSFVVLTEKAYKPIHDYLQATRKATKPEEPLFTSTSNNSKNERLTTRTISQIAKDSLRAIGLDEKAYTAHSLRHTTAVNILRAGGSIETAQLTLRHSNPATTQIYTTTLDEERRLSNSGEALLDSLY